MKKFITALTAICLISAAAVPAVSYADNSTGVSVTDSSAMETALINVKSRIDVPSELTKFSGNVRISVSGNVNVSDSQQSFSFRWENDDYSKTLSVDADEKGRIFEYSYYSESSEEYNFYPVLSKVPEEDAKAKAEEFLKKAVPEAFDDASDVLEVDSFKPDSYSEYGFRIVYKRVKDGVEVLNNGISLSADYRDGVLTVKSMYAAYDYDAEFTSGADSLGDINASYRALYPEEIMYAKIYDYSVKQDPDYDGEIKLAYRIAETGYMSAETGEKLTLKHNNHGIYYGLGGTSGSAAATMAVNEEKSALTDEEITELENISGLYTAAEAQTFIKGLPKLNISDGMELTDSSLTSQNTTPKTYSLSLTLSDDTTSLLATFDAENKRLTYLRNYNNDSYYVNSDDDEETTFTSEEIAKYNTETDKFLNAVISDKIGEFKEDEGDMAKLSSTYRRSFTRMVDDIPYYDNSISVSYNIYTDTIKSYLLDYENNAVFPSTDGAISPDEAYERILEISPLKKYYISTEDGYKTAYTIDDPHRINALTGEDLDKSENYDTYSVEYDDISGHWCESAVTTLVKNGIALEGTSFKPDEAINQEDLVRLVLTVSNGRYILNNTTDDLYDYCYSSGILDESERNETASVTREQAFVYLIRAAGFEKVAKLSGIYTVTYADSDMLSDGLIGYAAILSGMGVIEGDGGTLRPQDNLTRAEAAAMIYRYMSN